MSDKVYYVRMRGRVTGPFDAEQLRHMAGMGKLSRAHEVSTDKQTWQSASRLEQVFHAASRVSAHQLAEAEETETPSGPELSTTGVDVPPTLTPATEEYAVAETATSWSPAQAVPSPGASPETPGAEPAATGKGLSSQVNKLSLTQGICAGAVVLFCLLVPHSRGSDGLQWWWDLGSQVFLLVFCIYGMLLGVALTFVPVLIRGQWRGWVYLAASAVASLLLTAAVGLSQGGSIPLAIAVPLPLLMAGTIGVSLLRLATPTTGGIRPWQIAVSAAACAVALAAGIATVRALVIAGAGSSERGWIVLTIVVTALGWLAALAGGVTGLIVGVSQRASSGAGKAAVGASIAGLALLALAAVIAGFIGATGSGSGDRFVLVQALRLVVVAYTLAALAAAGLSEILASRAESDTGRLAGAVE